MVYIEVGISLHHRASNFDDIYIDDDRITINKYIRWLFITTPIIPLWSSDIAYFDNESNIFLLCVQTISFVANINMYDEKLFVSLSLSKLLDCDRRTSQYVIVEFAFQIFHKRL